MSEVKEQVTISKTDFLRLKKQAQAYRTLAASVFRFAVKDPVKEVVQDFQDTNLYTDGFINDLESGLRKSSYPKQYAHKTVARRS